MVDCEMVDHEMIYSHYNLISLPSQLISSTMSIYNLMICLTIYHLNLCLTVYHLSHNLPSYLILAIVIGGTSAELNLKTGNKMNDEMVDCETDDMRW